MLVKSYNVRREFPLRPSYSRGGLRLVAGFPNHRPCASTYYDPGDVAADPLYGAINTDDVSVTSIDDEINCFGSELMLTEDNFPPDVILDCAASDWLQIDPDSDIIGDNAEVTLTAKLHRIIGRLRVGNGSILNLQTSTP